MIDALDIHVKGIVQGVGFRPFVYRLAKKYLIKGWVLNATDGVHIRAEGEEKLLDEFVMEISENAPAAAQVSEIEMKEVPLEPFDSFEIRFSDEESTEEATFVSPDLATCPDCVRELFDPKDRRYRYPFVNCTNCGPRFTIIDKLPYDRARTSMKEFPMCDPCQGEYDDPADRRFHAQPNACFECGPHISFSTDAGKSVRWGTTREESDAIFAEAVKMLLDGKVLAVKGLGGFHLVCDAGNAGAVARLRERKRRFGKAFAVMMESLDDVRQVCEVGVEEAAVLEGSARPIVLLRKQLGVGIGVQEGVRDDQAGNAQNGVLGSGSAPTRRRLEPRSLGSFGLTSASPHASDAFESKNPLEAPDLNAADDSEDPHGFCASGIIVSGVADGLPELGVMLPYTPVQHILMHDFAKARARATEGSGIPQTPPMLVMTSGNVHDEPICIKDDEAYERLEGIADAFFGNDREILTRFDDSVVRVIRAGSAGETVQMIRRARGYAPTPVPAPMPTSVQEGSGAAGPAPTIFAAGSEQKNTFAFLRPAEDAAEVFVSQHIGDMENADAFDAWIEAKRRYEQLFDLHADELACDLHPEYITSKWAREQSKSHKPPIPLAQVQHHHAHIASVIAENAIPANEAVCGIAFDGTGYGIDGNIWGGEVLMSNMADFERFANFAYVPMPGGAAAVRRPLQMAYGVLWEFDLLDHPGAAPLREKLGEAQLETLGAMIDQGLNTPVTSSVGRLFDAASALLGVCTHPTYEGEPAILLEAALWEGFDDAGNAVHDGAAGNASSNASGNAGTDLSRAQSYKIDIVKNVATETSTAHDTSVLLFDAAPAFRALLDDQAAGVPVPEISRRFHNAFVDAILQAAQLSAALYDVRTVALSGGVFMNRYIVENALETLEKAGFTVAVNRDLPPNDGCISYGEAVVACAKRQLDEKD